MIRKKRDDEIQRMREAGRLLAKVLQFMGGLVIPGVRTVDLDREAEAMIRGAGAIPTFKGYQGFPGTLCTSVNEVVVHGIPGDRTLTEGDIISIDCGVTLGGYVADAAQTFAVGRIRPEIEALMATTRRSLYKAIDACRPGARLGTVSHAVDAHCGPAGYGVVREYCGHGVGRALHEDPQIPNYGRPGTGPMLETGWTLAIEPMINLGTHRVRTLDDGWTVVTEDGRPSAHFEHTIAVTADGPVILTLP
ncbi:MAG: type I methionyl aminopeptidase [Pseudomonadota bacterium]